MAIGIHFRGAEAEQHHIEAFTGAESLAGIGRACTIVAHYTATNVVRFRRPYDNSVQFLIEAVEPGSLSVLISAAATAARPLDIGRLTTSASRLLGHIIRRAVGKGQAGGFQVDGHAIPDGDIDALAEAVTPGIARAHSWIDSADKSIIMAGNHFPNTQLDEETKEYVTAEVEAPGEDVQDVSVGALNVNARTGRVYFHDIGRTVPFYVPKAAAARTIPTLARYLTQYADKTGATVNIRFRRVRHLDDRLKRIVISDCYAIAGLR